MNINFRNTTREDRLSKLSAIFNRQPELLYRNPYINFLREFRIRHLDLEIPELYNEGARAWIKLSDKEKKIFRYLDIIKDIRHRRAMKELRSKLEKKRKRAKLFMSRRRMRRDKRKLYPLRTTKRQKHKPNRFDTKKKSLQNTSQNAERIRNIFQRLRSLNIKQKTGKKRQRKSQRRLPQRHRGRRRRRFPRKTQIKRRK